MVVIVGDLNVDVVCRYRGSIATGSDTPAETALHLGGSPCNVAAWLATVRQDFAFHAAVGDDALGDWARGALERTKIPLENVVTLSGRTGSCVVLVAPDGERTMFPDPGVNLDLSAQIVGPLPMAHWLQMSAYSFLRSETRALALDLLANAQARGLGVVVDAASAAPIEHVGVAVVRDYLAQADLVIANEDEAGVLGLAWLTDLPGAIIKRGASAAGWYSRGELLAEVLPPQVEVVDTTGAGDAFCAGLLSVLADRQPTEDLGPHEALAAAVRFGSHACTVVGAQP